MTANCTYGYTMTTTPTPLVEELRDRIRYLEEESRRKDHLLAAALERIPPIEAPESPESTSVGSGNTHAERERRRNQFRCPGGVDGSGGHNERFRVSRRHGG
jgi:hypothetical protein